MDRKRVWIPVTFLLFLLAGVVTLFFYGQKKYEERMMPQNGSRPAVFFAPHPDDETLNMGVSIAEKVQAGRPVYIVLLTCGVETGALKVINRSLRSSELCPQITKDQIGLARVREFYKASSALGVPNRNVFLENLDRNNNSITYNAIKEVTTKYINQFPGSDFFTMSWVDVQAVHRLSGEVLRDLCDQQYEGLDRDKIHFFISMATKMDMEKRVKTIPGKKDCAEMRNVKSRVRQAMGAYDQWDPKKGLYAVGYNSVYRQFKRFDRELYHYVHGIDINKK